MTRNELIEALEALEGDGDEPVVSEGCGISSVTLEDGEVVLS